MENKRKLTVDKSAAKKHEKQLNALLSGFFRFLDKKPKPTDEEVRAEFQRKEMEWKTYCAFNNLDIRTSLLFNAKVSYEWEQRYVKRPNT